jgi:GntR family transcriptional regulator, arabinose operon transcriptional repressor
MPLAAGAQPPKYRQVYDALVEQILGGRMNAGARLPSEADLGRRFGASRITVGRALRDLQTAGLVERRAGSGTFVRVPHAAVRAQAFGVLMPEVGDVEVFDAICHGLLEAPEARQHVLVWGSRPSTSSSKADHAWRLCEQYIDRQVDGVFFAPIELTPNKDSVNRRIAEALAAARIPVVLIDRAIEPFPRRGRHDLVALDNRRAGALITEHLLSLGCARPVFLGLPNAASSVDGREAGFREAVRTAGLDAATAGIWREDPADRLRLAALLQRDAPDGIVCASDRTAAVLMHGLRALGRRMPEDIRLVGIDDVDYAGLLPVPLTTLRQPCHEIGVSAMRAMVDRVGQPDLPPREILLHGTLIVRESCGSSITSSITETQSHEDAQSSIR